MSKVCVLVFSAIMAARDKSTTVTFRHFESALERFIVGAEKKTNVLQPGE